MHVLRTMQDVHPRMSRLQPRLSPFTRLSRCIDDGEA